MRILFVWPSSDWAVADVARGLRDAFWKQGHEIQDFRLDSRLKYHALPISYLPDSDNHKDAMLEITRQASDTMVVEALYFNADLVFVVSGLNLHPGGLWLLKQTGFHVALLLTESPYDDEDQKDFAQLVDVVFTNDLLSASHHPDWHYVPHSIDPALHRPWPADPDKVCDVFMVSSAWPERRSLLEAVDWEGIDFRLFGFWPNVSELSNLAPHVRNERIPNQIAAHWYSSAKISLNHHRQHPTADSMNPRVREIVACGGFCISDPRPEIERIFGTWFPTYRTAEELSSYIRYFLAHEDTRLALAARARACLGSCTFDDRARDIMNVIGSPHRSRSHAMVVQR